MLPLPQEFEWHDVNVGVTEDLYAIHRLLDTSYIENETWKLDYTRSFLSWALQGCENLCIRVISSKLIVGFVSCCEMDGGVFVNFLCVHKKLRKKKMTNVLISELTRRVKERGMNQAFFTSGSERQNRIATCNYYHRYLRVENLMQHHFIPPTSNIRIMSKLYSLPPSPLRFRKVDKMDCEKLSKLLGDHAREIKVKLNFTADACERLFVNPNVFCYVLGEIGSPTDMVSFYCLPLKNKLTKAVINSCYLWYHVHTTLSLEELIGWTLVTAKMLGFDVLNCLDVFENNKFLTELKFVKGTGELHYHSHSPQNITKEMINVLPL